MNKMLHHFRREGSNDQRLDRKLEMASQESFFKGGSLYGKIFRKIPTDAVGSPGGRDIKCQ